MYLFRIVWLLVMLLWATPTHAQKAKDKVSMRQRETEGFLTAGVQMAAFNFVGDIPSGFGYTRPGMAFFITRKLGARMHARLSFSVGRVEGDDFSGSIESGVYSRNLHFRNNLKELAGIITYDFKPSFGKYSKRRYFTPYLLWGLGLLHHNPQAKMPDEIGDKWVNLQPLGTEGQGRPGYRRPYSLVQPIVAVGFGFKWKINNRWDFAMEISPRFTFTDYLDDVSGEYPNMDDLGNPLAVAMSNRTLERRAALAGQPRDLEAVLQRNPVFEYQGFDGQTYRTIAGYQRGFTTRGNVRTLDFYVITGFTLNYIVNVGLKCPSPRPR